MSLLKDIFLQVSVVIRLTSENSFLIKVKDEPTFEFSLSSLGFDINKTIDNKENNLIKNARARVIKEQIYQRVNTKPLLTPKLKVIVTLSHDLDEIEIKHYIDFCMLIGSIKTTLIVDSSNEMNYDKLIKTKTHIKTHTVI